MDENDTSSADNVEAIGPLHLNFTESQPLPPYPNLQWKRRNDEEELKELLTDMSGGSGSYGIMFDLESPRQYSIIISSIHILVNIEKEECPVRVYYKEGTHRGSEKNPNDWKLIVNDATHCQGFEKRTSILSEMFTETITIPSNGRIAFYVTLSTPNLRYTKPAAGQESSISDNYLTIYDGTGLGDLFDKAFYPRIFNGVIAYKTERDKHVTLGNGDCKDSVQSTGTDTSSVYGHMFDVSTKTQGPVYLKGMEIRTNLKTEFDYVIYTLPKSVASRENDLSKWDLVASGTVRGRGPGVWTPLLPFNVEIPSKEPRGFYVSFKNSDLLTLETSKKTGLALVEDTFVSIMTGIDVFDYPLRTNTITASNKGWYGRLYYSTNDAVCDLIIPPESTPVYFIFVVKHHRAYNLSDLLTYMEASVSSSISGFLQSDEWLLRMRRYYNLEVSSVKSVSSKEDLSDMCTENTSTDMCTTVSTTVSFLHQSGVNRGHLIYTILSQSDQIIISLESSGDLTVLNGGDKVHESTSVITLLGIPDVKMGLNEQTFYEESTKAFLRKFLYKASVDILDVAVTKQSLFSTRRHLQASSSGIDITTVVTGKHRPPPELDFALLVNDAVNDNPESLRKELNDVNHIGSSGSLFFKEVKTIAARPVGPDIPSPTSSPTAISTTDSNSRGVMSGAAGVLIMITVAILVFALVFGMFVLYKRRHYFRKKARRNIEDDLLFGDLKSRNNIVDDLLDTDIEVVKPPEPKQNLDDDCATTTDMTFDSKRSRHSEIRDAIMSQEGYHGDVKRRPQEEPDGAMNEGFHDYNDEKAFNPPRYIGLSDDRGRGKKACDDQSEITFASSAIQRKTAQQLEEESYAKLYKEKVRGDETNHRTREDESNHRNYGDESDDRAYEEESYHRTPEFGEDDDDHNDDQSRSYVSVPNPRPRSQPDRSRRHSMVHTRRELQSYYGDTQRRRSSNENYIVKRKKIDDLEAEYEERIRRGDVMDCDRSVRTDTSGRTGRRSHPGTNKEQLSRYGRSHYRSTDVNSSSNSYCSDPRRKNMYRSYERSRPDLYEDLEQEESYTDDPPAHQAKPMKFIAVARTPSVREKKLMAGETLISTGTNSTLSTLDHER